MSKNGPAGEWPPLAPKLRNAFYDAKNLLDDIYLLAEKLDVDPQQALKVLHTIVRAWPVAEPLNWDVIQEKFVTVILLSARQKEIRPKSIGDEHLNPQGDNE